MVAIALPAAPAPVDKDPFLISFAQDHEPFLGGEQIRILRVGTRFGAAFKMPPMKMDVARSWIARLTQGEGFRVSMLWRQLDFVNQKTNTTVYADTLANAFSLPLSGGSGSPDHADSGTRSFEGQFFNVIHDDRRYLHMVTGWQSNTVLNVWPALRTPLVAGDVVDFETPRIEGILVNHAGWNENKAMTVGLEFVIRESK